jgi:hypothetical protein
MTNRLQKISLRFYLTILGLTIPLYFIGYGATGHQFNIPTEDQLWLLVAGLSLITATIYTFSKQKNGLTNTGLKILFGICLIVSVLGGLKLLIEMAKFNADNNPGFMFTVLTTIIPLGFIGASGLLLIGLIRRVE